MSKDRVAGRSASGNTKDFGAIYRGQYFYSRQAAVWGAFFNKLNWDWRYRPVLRNGWQPDFSLGRDIDRAVHCLVLPINVRDVTSDQMLATLAPYEDVLKRAYEATRDDKIAVLGHSPFPSSDGFFSYLGWFTSAPWNRARHGNIWLSADEDNGQRDFVWNSAPYRGAVTGRDYDHSNEHISGFVDFRTELWPTWVEAVNAVPVPNRSPVKGGK